MEFRLAIEQDISQLCHLRWQQKVVEELETPLHDEETYHEVFNHYLVENLNQTVFVWVGTEVGRIVATAYITKVRKLPKPGKYISFLGYVSSVYTDEKLRNQKIGSQLFECVTEWSKSNEIELLFLWPSEKSGHFYERLGFKAENEIIEREL